MRFSTSAQPIEIPGAMIRTCTFIGWERWEKRILSITQQISENPFLREIAFEKYGRELALFDAWKYYHDTKKPLWPPTSDGLYRLYSFFTMFSKLHYHMSDVGRRRITGMARDGLKSENGLAELAFEFLTVNHLMNQGFDVTCNDYENRMLGGTYDFLVEKDGIEIEVEDKYVSADIGRKIHQRRLYQLGKWVLPLSLTTLNSGPGGTLVRVFLPDRLTGSPDQHEAISQGIGQALEFSNSRIDGDDCRIEIENFNFDECPLNMEEPDDSVRIRARQYFEEEHDVENRNMLMLFRPSHGAVVITIQSEKPDQVLNGIYRQLKGSAKNQFSGTRPAALFVYLSDITVEQLDSLAAAGKDKPTGLQLMANDLIARRPVLHTVCFVTPGVVTTKEKFQDDIWRRSLQESGGVYTFRNPEHPQVDEPVCNLV
ncbi:MAG: hypothetical protein HOH80_15265 [Rhodospirillaceae bacterium]|jgi:hypothetical protein|nr:hypothetical protein [Rhodospirillales bacterium]MBT4117357.1 hypothetical protein [Rhodospirillaceae bacterium]MBT5840356.1 hypothetical protein [Rhodospirillaceae bacterium]MBT7235729.1 hypothetical protein [Rhodospirillaceae bacterium]MBT7570404.1 hypothetical protein [Rhodospirillaceae bacterium]